MVGYKFTFTILINYDMLKRCIPLLLIAILSQLAIVNLFAVKAYPFPVTITQPDGTLVTVVLHGNEFHHFRTSDDGYLLKANAKGFLTYATLNAAGEVIESDVQAHNLQKRSLTELQFLKSVKKADILQETQSRPLKSNAFKTPSLPQKAFPSTGSPRSLVILVNFSDNSFVTSTPQVAFTNLLNQDSYSTNGGTGSARDYFMASTYGKFSPTFDVVGPYTLPHPLDFYGKNDASGNDTNDIQMVVDACTQAFNKGVDFAQYDTDNDGVVDNVFIYYAGYNEAEHGPANTIWPHRWAVYPASLFPSGSNYTGTVASVTFNGKRVFDYACTSELKGASGSNMCGVGTFCHEFGHVLGLPDYYDTAGTNLNTLNSWDIMDAGNYNNQGRTPPTYSVYDRFFLGYLVPQQESMPANLTLDPIYQGKTPPASTTNQAFLLSATTHNLSGTSPAPPEFFMLEYRQKTGWDTYLPAEGMCIWHIDYDQAAWDNNSPNVYTGTSQTLASHMRVYLVPPTGVGTTPPTTAFTTGSFTPTLWTGTDINRTLTNITKTATNVSFSFMSPTLLTTGSFTGYTTTLGAQSVAQSIDVTARNITGNLNLDFLNSTNFDIKLSTDASWSKNLSLVPVAGTINATVQVRFNPFVTGTLTDQLVLTNPGLTSANFNVSGTSTIGPNSPVIFVGKIDNSLSFSPTKLNSGNTKTINIQTTDLTDNLTLAVSGTDAAMFAVPATTITRDAANATGGFNITITYTPASIGNHSATLTVSGGGLIPAKVITLTGSGI